MLSKCVDCKYHHPGLCAVNPSYRVMQNKLRLHLSDTELDTCEVGILPCNDWEASEELQPLMLELTLSGQEWHQLLSTGHDLPHELISQIQTAIAKPGEIVMVPVESSNIAAIGYDSAEQVLQVDFWSETRYRYFAVPQWKFDEFLAAPSKGCFFNIEIKGVFEYEWVS